MCWLAPVLGREACMNVSDCNRATPQNWVDEGELRVEDISARDGGVGEGVGVVDFCGMRQALEILFDGDFEDAGGAVDAGVAVCGPLADGGGGEDNGNGRAVEDSVDRGRQ